MEETEYREKLKKIEADYNKGFRVYFNANDQTYSVFKDGKFVIGNKYKFTDVKCYLD